MLNNKRILLVIGGGIAAYKCLELVRRLRERGVSTRVVMTKAAQNFVTPLSVGALTNEPVLTSLFDLNEEREIGHIKLSRETDLIVVAPATANLLAKMAGGHADDLATTVLMATNKPVLVAPAMNPLMWSHPATKRNVAQLQQDGLQFVGPAYGEMAERDEAGVGRLADIPVLVEAITAALHDASGPGSVRTPNDGGRTTSIENPVAKYTSSLLAGKHVLVTAGPTHEPIDPVRYIANRSSGKQGYALAAAAAEAGANVTLVSGPTSLPSPAGVTTVRVETAREMLKATKAALPADIAIFTAAVADWRVASATNKKIKKSKDGIPSLELVENPDILKTIAHTKKSRPKLVIGFAAETNAVVAYARKKRKKKSADWIVANDVSPATGVMGGDNNQVHLITNNTIEDWPKMTKAEVAKRVIERAAYELLDLAPNTA